MELIFEKSRPGRSAAAIPECDVPPVPIESCIDKKLLRDEVDLPEAAEVDLVRHYIALSRLNFGVDNGFYPLGSCTMKYNPKINEDVARFVEFTALHPLAPESFSQGSLRLIYELKGYLAEICAMADFTLQPAAGAHGELTGIMVIKKYFEKKGQRRRKIGPRHQSCFRCPVRVRHRHCSFLQGGRSGYRPSGRTHDRGGSGADAHESKHARAF
jgi:glycine dehydrogenase subunit 2